MATPFLKRKDTLAAIEQLASADRLTIVVGAGASVESGLPDWSGLVTALLVKVAQEAGLANGDCERFAEWSLRSDGLPGAGALTKAWLDEPQFTESIRGELYRASGENPRPGPTAKSVAELRMAFGPACEIVTQNYDVLIEAALRDAGFHPGQIKSYVTATPGPPGSAPVRHLHGILAPDTERGTVVLSESDYHLMQDRNRWQERHMRDRLAKTTCLFVGTSLSDPNLLRYLYRASGGQRHVAVFVRQADDWWYSESREGVLRAREQSVLRRWESVNVTPLLADYFAQSAQFVAEVARRRSLGHAYRSYHDRVVEWEWAVERTLLTKAPRRFRNVQERLQQSLAAWCRTIEGFLDAARLRRADEHLGLHLWVRDPSQRALVRLGSSARVWRSPQTLQHVPIARPTRWVAVEAFCAGTALAQQPSELSRWNYVLGFPVVLDDPKWGRLPVGVLTLASTAAGDDGGLQRLDPLSRGAVVRYLAENAARLLNP